ncbi:hypothetical protein AB5J62_24725 [Amycolatopsis sp. cg5]|uniref:hypothetical protein n=1 Tax=Amycolatopsis sp. cg5 TaxID=3238802 RepID=UPI003523B884
MTAHPPPLTLPAPDMFWDPAAAVIDPDIPPRVAADPLYRWVLGHQIAFGVWRLIADNLAEIASGGKPDFDPAWLFDQYSILLLYTGSFTEIVYRERIRPSMMAADPAFSGRWGRDYHRVLRMLEAAKPHDTVLRDALLRNRRVHIAVARRLVPEGGSLLRDAGRASAPVTDAEFDIFDTYFGVRRAPCDRRGFLRSLASRAQAAHDDLVETPPAARLRGQVAVAPDGLHQPLLDLAATIAEAANNPKENV